MDLQSDSQGFLLGEARLKEIASGIDGVSDNTQAILDILTTQAEQVKASLKQVVREISSQNRNNRRNSNNGRDSLNTGNTRNANQNSNSRSNRTSRNQPIPTESPAERMERIRRNRQASNPNNPLNNPASTRRRGANGRFEGAGANDSQNSDGSPNNANGRRRGANGRFEGDGSTEQSGLQKLGKIIGDSVGQSLNIDAQGVDPLLDSVRELNQIITPGKRAFTLMGRGALWLFKRNRKPEISDEQDDANDQANRNDVTRNKLLQKLIDAVRSGRGGGGMLGGLLGGRGMFGKLGKLGKGLLKRIPLLGALLGGGMLASNWGGLNKDEKYEGVGGVAGAGIGAIIGGTLGSVVPVVGTAIGAMVGGVVGNWLGENAGKKLSEWTDYLESEDIGGNIGRAWTVFTTGMGTWFKERYGAIADGIKTGWDTVLDLFKVIPNGFDQLLARFGNKEAQARIALREKQAEARKRPPMVFRTDPQPTTIGGVLADTGRELMGGGDNKSISKSTEGKVSQAYQAAIGAGFSHKQSIALVGEVGRENDFNEKNMFGSHNDPARGKNLGIFSWQGKRRDNLVKFMSERGLMNKDGTIQRGQAALQAQFEFAKSEMQANSKWKDGFLDKKDISIEQARPELGGKGSFVGWARKQTTIRRADGSRIPFDWQAQENKANKYSTIAQKVSQIQAPTKAPTPTKATDLAKFAQNAEVPTTNAANNQAAAINKPTVAVPFAMPTSMPTKSPFNLKIPAMPAVSNKLSGNPTASNINVTAPQADIRQNVGDRTIAHIVTGGFGMQGMDV